MDNELATRIEDLAIKEDRDTAKQVRHMLRSFFDRGVIHRDEILNAADPIADSSSVACPSVAPTLD